MKSYHIWPCVFIGTSELANQIVGDCVMKFGDIADILKPEGIEPIVGQCILVELRYYEWKFLLSSYFIDKLFSDIYLMNEWESVYIF